MVQQWVGDTPSLPGWMPTNTVGDRTVVLNIIARCSITQTPTGQSNVWWWHARKIAPVTWREWGLWQCLTTCTDLSWWAEHWVYASDPDAVFPWLCLSGKHLDLLSLRQDLFTWTQITAEYVWAQGLKLNRLQCLSSAHEPAPVISSGGCGN